MGASKGRGGASAGGVSPAALAARLLLSEAQLTSIVEVSADAIVAMDESQRITLFNVGAERMFGYARDEVLGQPLDLLIPDRMRAAHHAGVARFAVGDVSARRMGELGRPVRGRRKDGAEIDVDVAIAKIDVGGARTFTATLRDVTAQRRADQQQRFLAEAGALLSSTLDFEETLTQVAGLAVRELTDVCIVDVVDDDGQLRRLRAVARDASMAWACDVLMRVHLGRDRPHLASEAVASRRTLLMTQVDDALLVRVAQSDEHLRALRALGSTSALVVPMVARDQVVGTIGMLATGDARRLGVQDQALAEALALRAAQAIDNARLYRLAQRALHARDEVLGIVAHDLRNPLSAVLMQAQLLAPRLDAADQRALASLDAIRRAVLRMNRMIEDLLDATRLDAGRLAVDREQLAPAPLVAEVVDAQGPLAAAAGIELGLVSPGDVPAVLADRNRLQQVLENLIGNAIKFTGHGGRVTVTLSCPGDEVVFAVSDSGGGIAPDDLPHIFDRFWQGRAQDRRGAGLGLQIAKGLVEAHGGHMHVESAVGTGTTFWFAIPVAPPPAR